MFVLKGHFISSNSLIWFSIHFPSFLYTADSADQADQAADLAADSADLAADRAADQADKAADQADSAAARFLAVSLNKTFSY